MRILSHSVLLLVSFSSILDAMDGDGDGGQRDGGGGGGGGGGADAERRGADAELLTIDYVRKAAAVARRYKNAYRALRARGDVTAALEFPEIEKMYNIFKAHRNAVDFASKISTAAAAAAEEEEEEERTRRKAEVEAAEEEEEAERLAEGTRARSSDHGNYQMETHPFAQGGRRRRRSTAKVSRLCRLTG